MKHSIVGLFFVLLSLLLVSAACVPPAPEVVPAEGPVAVSTEAEPVEPQQPLVVLIDNDEGPITPANYNTFIGWWMVGWVYDPLFVRSPDLIPIPNLATDAIQSEDGLTWEITLRDDVTWHDGEPFNVEDVIFSYQFLMDSARAPALNVIESVEANGDYGLTLNLSSPSPFFLNEGLAGYYIMPEHIWRDVDPISDELNQFQGTVGTGPFKLLEISPGESYTLEANADYFRGEPNVDTLIAKVVKDRTQQFNQLRSGSASAVLSSVLPALVEELSGNPDIDLAQGSDFFNYMFYTNGSRPPFDDVKVRQAISQAIDAETLVEVIMLGLGTELPLSYYHPDLPWSIDIPGSYDPAAAMALLDEAGVVDSDGDGIREYNGEATKYEILCDVNSAVEVRSTELIKGWLADVGIGSSQNCIDIDTAVTYIWPSFVAVPDPDYDLAIWGWSSGPQFQRGFIRFLTHGDLENVGWANLTGMSFPELDALTDEYVSNPDPVRQEELNQEIQEFLAENLPFISLMSPGGNFAYRPADYDGWVYVKGTGIMTAWSYLPTEASQ